jgi:hypothetical protein
MSASDWPKLASTLAQLESLYSFAGATNAMSVASGLVLGPFGQVSDETRAGNRAALAVVRSYLDRLGPMGDLGQGVMSESVTVDRWLTIANAQGAGLNDVLSSLGEDASRFWKEVVIQTGSDVATITKDVAFGGGVGVGAVVALIIAAKVLGK